MTAETMTTKQALEGLRELTQCKCHPAFADRGMEDPDCQCDYRPDVEALAAHLAALAQRVEGWEAVVTALIRELRDAGCDVERDPWRVTNRRADRAEAEARRLGEDADRYAWLREQDWFSAPLAVVVRPKEAIKLGHDCPSRERLDAAIDDEMAAARRGAN